MIFSLDIPIPTPTAFYDAPAAGTPVPDIFLPSMSYDVGAGMIQFWQTYNQDGALDIVQYLTLIVIVLAGMGLIISIGKHT